MNELAADLRSIDEALRLVDREIWVVTAAAGERRGGLVATWVSAASIDAKRPVLLAGLAPNHFTTELVQAGNVFRWAESFEAALRRSMEPMVVLRSECLDAGMARATAAN